MTAEGSDPDGDRVRVHETTVGECRATVDRVRLPLAAPFGIARGTTTVAENVLVELDDGTHAGVGAAAPSAHYGETADTVTALLPDLLAALDDAVAGDGEEDEAATDGAFDPHAWQTVATAMADRVRANPAARAAVDVAVHDLAARRFDAPLYRVFGLDPARTVPSSYTIGLAAPEAMATRAERAVDAGYDVLKVKLGDASLERDRDRLMAVRTAAPDARLRVDANEGWTVAATVRADAWLEDADVEFLEQPVPAEHGRLGAVDARTTVPICADESCVTATDVPAIADACGIVNVKLMKCGGLWPARRQIAAARAHGLEVMVGCMVESAAAIAAAWHLTPLVDYADLDGAALVADGVDPYAGVAAPGGRAALADVTAGTGARPARERNTDV